MLIFAVYILTSLSFGALFSSANNSLAQPTILNSSITSSIFILGLVICLFCYDTMLPTINSDYYSFNCMFLYLFLFSAVAVLFITRDFIGACCITRFEYDVLFSFVLFSSMCLCFADDFLLTYLSIEMQSLCFYTLATFNRTSDFSTESGLKYFVFGSVISCFLLLGFALVYSFFGNLTFESLLCFLDCSTDSYLFLAILFILTALLFKIGAAPFHF
jgi:NADH-quinone oxidoreductase subunit N